MNLSLEWLSEFVSIDGIGVKEYCDKLTDTGSKVECYEELGSDIENVVVGLVKEMKRHENSDHMWICSIDVGDEAPLQIVTGAQNVFEGALVPVAKAPAKLPGGITIKTGKLRGVESQGMLCSIAELNLTTHDMPGKAEDGILILDEGQVGADVRDALRLKDTSVEFEITSNRPDCLSVIGLARETAASFDRELKLHTPEVKECGDGNVRDYVNVSVAAPELCYRYCARAVKNVKIQPSPLWLRMRLRASGVRPINNIVDITNYVMLEYGQPMHAFDYKCLSGSEIVVRRARDGESFRSLDSVDHTLDSSMLVIADRDRAVALAGVMGGENSEITDNTATVIFESACFEGSSVRVSAKKLGMRTESSARFEKGLDPENCRIALERACELVQLLGAGEVVPCVIDEYPGKKESVKLTLDAEKINKFLGIDLDRATMVSYLAKLGVEVDDNNVITVPSWRSDLGCMNDIAEEIVRIYGYNRITSTGITASSTLGGRTEKQQFTEDACDALCGFGYTEIETFSFISPKYYDKIGMPEDSALRRSVVISNPLGEDTSVMRTVALPSMMEVLARNYNYSTQSVRLYEMATVYLPDEDATKLPQENKQLVIGMYGGCDFYDAKGICEAIAELARIKEVGFIACRDDVTFHPGRCAVMTAPDGSVLAKLGQIHPVIAENYGMSVPVYAAVVDFEQLYAQRGAEPEYKHLPKFPATTRDFSFVCDNGIEVGAIIGAMKKAGVKLLEDARFVDIYRSEQLGADKKSVTFRIWLRSQDHTITLEEADRAANKILASVEREIGITIRK